MPELLAARMPELAEDARAGRVHLLRYPLESRIVRVVVPGDDGPVRERLRIHRDDLGHDEAAPAPRALGEEVDPSVRDAVPRPRSWSGWRAARCGCATSASRPPVPRTGAGRCCCLRPCDISRRRRVNGPTPPGHAGRGTPERGTAPAAWRTGVGGGYSSSSPRVLPRSADRTGPDRTGPEQGTTLRRGDDEFSRLHLSIRQRRTGRRLYRVERRRRMRPRALDSDD